MKAIKRIFSLLVVVVVIAVVWFVARPSQVDIRTAEPLTAFHQAVERGRPIFIMFTKGGCRACLAMYPIVAELIEEYQDRVSFIVADIANEQTNELRSIFEFQVLPHFVMIGRQGQEERLTGHVPKETLRNLIEAGLVWAP